MLNEVLNELNNYFKTYSSLGIEYAHSLDVTFTSTGTLTSDFTDTFLAGEYIKISGSRLNDGVYLISAIDDTTITIDTTLDYTITTEEEISCTIAKCGIPKSLISLIAEIKTYNTENTDGISSEEQGDVSISFANGSSWKSAFKERLCQYKRLRW